MIDERKQIETRAYYLGVDGYGVDDNHRFQMAVKIHNRIKQEKARELDYSMAGCCHYCYSRPATINVPYLTQDVCSICYYEHDSDYLLNNQSKHYTSIWERYRAEHHRILKLIDMNNKYLFNNRSVYENTTSKLS